VGVGVQGGVDRVREEGVKLVVHQPMLLSGEVDDRWGGRRSGGRRRGGRRGL
jgi:hypothetical protein